jgi:hypothetical protein
VLTRRDRFEVSRLIEGYITYELSLDRVEKIGERKSGWATSVGSRRHWIARSSSNRRGRVLSNLNGSSSPIASNRALPVSAAVYDVSPATPAMCSMTASEGRAAHWSGSWGIWGTF